MSIRYRGHTADDLTGPAAGMFQTMRLLGLSEAAALREAVDTYVPMDRLEVEQSVLEAFGASPAGARREVVRRNGGTEVEARRRLGEGAQTGGRVQRTDQEWARVHEAARRAGVLRQGEDPWQSEDAREFSRRVAAAEARGLSLTEAIAEASAPAPSADSSVTALREANDQRARTVFDRDAAPSEDDINEAIVRMFGGGA